MESDLMHDLRLKLSNETLRNSLKTIRRTRELSLFYNLIWLDEVVDRSMESSFNKGDQHGN